MNQRATHAVAYDFLQVRGGAENVTLGLAARIERTEAVVSAWNTTAFDPEALDRVRRLRSAELPSSPILRGLFAVRAFLGASARFSGYEGVCFSGHYSALAARSLPGQQRIYYAHGLPLQCALSIRRTRASALPVRGFLLWYGPRMREALRRMDKRYANSAENAELQERHHGCRFEVLPPPCDVERFRWRPSNGYFLCYARQEPGKGVERVVEAFRHCPGHTRLLVASGGSLNAKLRSIAGGARNIEFIDQKEPVEIARLVSRCRATIYLAEHEPFGLSVVESLAAGKPVLVCDSGVPSTLVEPKRTGWMVPAHMDGHDLARLIGAITDSDCEGMRPACEAAAKAYSWQRFLTRLNFPDAGGLEARRHA